jgi:hypothetical protein
MDYMLCRQPITLCDLGIAGLAALEHPAFSQKPRSCGSMDGAIHTTAAEQGGVGSVDDGVNAQARDVGDDDFQPRITALARSESQADAGALTVTPFSANSCCNSPA